MLPSATWSLYDLRRHQSSDDCTSGVCGTGSHMVAVQSWLHRFRGAGYRGSGNRPRSGHVAPLEAEAQGCGGCSVGSLLCRYLPWQHQPVCQPHFSLWSRYRPGTSHPALFPARPYFPRTLEHRRLATAEGMVAVVLQKECVIKTFRTTSTNEQRTRTGIAQEVIPATDNG